MIRFLPALAVVASAVAVVPQYFGIGFTHILPGGPDHILFILGLFFLTRNFGVLLFLMTLFTLGHSLALGLSLYGVVRVPTPLVEVGIALSIVFIALENLWRERFSRWRPAVVSGSGLIHGLGFAHAFEETMVRPEHFLPALFSYNLGIECGQLAVVGIAFMAIFAVRGKSWYPTAVARPASLLIAGSGFYWAVERSF